VNSIGIQQRRLERGFTLVEVMVVIVVLGVLLALGIPTFFAARDRANDSAAKARATQALKSQRVAAADAEQRFRNAAELEAVEPSLDARPLTGAPSVLGVVYVKDPGTGAVVTLAAKSGSGKCFWTKATQNGITEYAVNDCSAEPLATEWGSSW
jgi:prepilin-type N-terminal cleavage/methylation domain-containing protein